MKFARILGAFSGLVVGGALLSYVGAPLPLVAQGVGQLGVGQIWGNPTTGQNVGRPVSPATARGSTLLNVEGATAVGDVNYSIASADRLVYTNAAFTTQHTFTLPLAANVSTGYNIRVFDLQGTVTTANKLTVARGGSDTIDGATSVILNSANQWLEFHSDGISKWMSSVYLVVGHSGEGDIRGDNTNVVITAKKTTGATITLVPGAGAAGAAPFTAGADGVGTSPIFSINGPAGLTGYLQITVPSHTMQAFMSAGTGGFKTVNADTFSIGANNVTGFTMSTTQHWQPGGTIPAVTACGTSPSIRTGSTDVAGEITAGTAAPAACTITFANAYAAEPFCTVQSKSQLAAFTWTSATTGINVTQTATSSNKIVWHCLGG